MENKNKFVSPGEHLASCEEFEAGSNTFTRNEETYSAAYGEVEIKDGRVSVIRKGKSVKKLEVGAPVYCYIRLVKSNKAIVECILESEVEDNVRGPSITAVLPIGNISRSRVREMRDCVRVGDILKARIFKITKDDVDISIFGKEFGVIKAYCSLCRHAMDLKDNIFICNNCNHKEKRKIPGGSDDYDNQDYKPRKQFRRS